MPPSLKGGLKTLENILAVCFSKCPNDLDDFQWFMDD